MTMSQRISQLSATAFPRRDAPLALPAARVKSKLAGAINIRKEFYLGCWNVRTLRDVGSQAITMRSLLDYQVDVACLSEVRLPGHGSKSIKVPGVDRNYWLFYSGPEDGSGQHGVAIALSDHAKQALMSWMPVSPRIAVVRLRGHPLNITVVSVYAPTLPADQTTKDDFYNQLQFVVDRVAGNDVLVVAGDWNARTGSADSATNRILGKFGLGQRCANGDRLIEFAAYNHLCVCNTKFQHPKKHLVTWYSNDGRTANQIDYVLIRARWMSSVLDCRSYRGAETGNAAGTDHTLVRAKLRLRLLNRQRKTPRKRLNLEALGNPAQRKKLIDDIAERLDGSDASVEQQWSRLKTATQTAALKTLGTASRRRRDWISQNTIELSARARDARMHGASDYRLLRRAATRSARKDRQLYWAETASEMEAAASIGDFGRLFRLIRRASGSCGFCTNLRDSSGQMIFDLHQKIDRWVEHFSQLLNRPSSINAVFTSPINSCEYPVNCEAPSEYEISSVLRRMQNGKSPGEDGISVELIKACADVLLSPLHRLFCSIWETEVFPSDWGMSIILPLPKRGDKSVCSNYRGISLIDTAAKVFATLLLNRFSAERNLRTRVNQGGFRPGMGCVDQIFTLRRILEHRARYQQQTIACFIDFRAAFDSVDRGCLWDIMLSDGVPLKLVNLIRAYYSSTRARVRVYGEESREFNLHTGVRQGCPLSPVMFNYVIDWIMNQALTEYQGVQISTDLWISDLDYADDIVVLGDNTEMLQSVLDRISATAAKVGLEINAAKTKAFFYSDTPGIQPLRVQGCPIEYVPVFKYLGSSILPNGQAKDEVKLRVDRARNAFLQLKGTLWRKPGISLKTKTRVYQAAIRPVLLYGCETWPLRSQDVRTLEVFDHWCLGVILGIRYTDRVSNAAVRERCSGLSPLSAHIQRRRLQWFGHVLRMTDTALPKLVLDPKPVRTWRRRQGGQVKTWLSTVKEDVDTLGLRTVYGVRRWERDWITICNDLASDRRAWAGAIRDINEAG